MDYTIIIFFALLFIYLFYNFNKTMGEQYKAMSSLKDIKENHKEINDKIMSYVDKSKEKLPNGRYVEELAEELKACANEEEKENSKSK